MSAPRYIHANALIVGETGLLLRGCSGAGKSTLTLDLIRLARADGECAILVGDDRVSVEASDGALIARPHPAIAGMIESRGVGILQVAYEPSCTVNLVVDLIPRGKGAQPAATGDAQTAEIEGVALPRLVENVFDGSAAARVFAYIHRLTAILP